MVCFTRVSHRQRTLSLSTWVCGARDGQGCRVCFSIAWGSTCDIVLIVHMPSTAKLHCCAVPRPHQPGSWVGHLRAGTDVVSVRCGKATFARAHEHGKELKDALGSRCGSARSVMSGKEFRLKERLESSGRDTALQDEPPEWRTLPAAGVQEVGPCGVRVAYGSEFYEASRLEFRVHLNLNRDTDTRAPREEPRSSCE